MTPIRWSNTLSDITLEEHRKSELSADKEPEEEEVTSPAAAPRDFK